MSGDSKKLDQILLKLQKLDSVEEKIDKLNNKFESLSAKVDSLESSVATNAACISTIQEELLAFKTETKRDIKNLKTSHNAREQRLRASTVRVFNIPYVVGEPLDNYKLLSSKVYDKVLRPALVAAKAAGDLGSVPQQQNVIEACYRAFTQQEPSGDGPPPPVIARLVSTAVKIAVLKHKKHIPVTSDAEKGGRVRRFIVVEDLTPEAHKLLRELQNDDRTDKVWSVNGRINFTIPGSKEVFKVKNIFDPVSEILK